MYKRQIVSFEQNLERAKKWTDEKGGGILVVTEGVFGMRGDQGILKEIAALKKKYNFRFFVDDAPVSYTHLDVYKRQPQMYTHLM